MAIVSVLYAIAAVIIVPNELNVPSGGSFDFVGSFLGVSGLVLVFFSLKYLTPVNRLMEVLVRH